MDHPDAPYYDEYGRLPEDYVITHNTRVFQDFPPLPMLENPEQIAVHMGRINVTVRVPMDTDILICTLNGDMESLAQVSTMWHLA